MSRLQGERCDLNYAADAPSGCGAVATRAGDVLHVLLWNHPPLEQTEIAQWSDSIRFSTKAKSLSVTSACIGAGHGSAWETWCQMGRPQHLSRAQEMALRFQAEPRWQLESFQPENDEMVVPFEVGAYEVLYLEIRPSEPAAIVEVSAEFERWNQAMGQKSR
jgi:hypothetical protein